MTTATPTSHSRRGFALPAAIFALVIVGVMVTGGFYIAQQEIRIGVANHNTTTAFYLAESGALDVAEEWDMSVYGQLAEWESTTVVDTVPQGTRSVDVLRTSPWTFFLESTGTVTEGGPMLSGATRRVGMAIRVRTALIEPPAALTTQGELTVGGSSQIFGEDEIPAGWGGVCDPADLADKPGILIDDVSQIRTAGSKYEVSGNPALEEDPGITIESLLDFGGVTWDDLTALASPPYRFGSETLNGIGPVFDADGRCVTTAQNWGGPDSPGTSCFNTFPIIYSTGDLKITGGAGQGILLVEGDLSVQGGFEFYGPVIVRGTLTTQGTGGHFNGGVIAANVNLDTSTVLGNAVVTYSSCAVSRAILNNSALSRAVRLTERSWVDLSNLAAN